MPMFSTYDEWKLATPPEYEWDGPEDAMCDCGMAYLDECRCYSTNPEDVADFIDEAQAASPQMQGRAGT